MGKGMSVCEGVNDRATNLNDLEIRCFALLFYLTPIALLLWPMCVETVRRGIPKAERAITQHYRTNFWSRRSQKYIFGQKFLPRCFVLCIK